MRNKQTGMGFLPLIMIVAALGTLGTAAVSLVPIYVDYWTLDGIIKDVVEESEPGKTSRAQVRKKLQSRFDTNRVESIKLKDIKILSTDQGIEIDAVHEKRTSLFFNIDAVVKFENAQYLIPRS